MWGAVFGSPGVPPDSTPTRGALPGALAFGDRSTRSSPRILSLPVTISSPARACVHGPCPTLCDGSTAARCASPTIGVLWTRLGQDVLDLLPHRGLLRIGGEERYVRRDELCPLGLHRLHLRRDVRPREL